MNRWENDRIQFARLICEIVATHDEIDCAALRESMDLDQSDLDALFDRANEAWEKAKRKVK